MTVEQSSFENKIDNVIRFLLYVLIFWLPYSSAVVETCVILSLILWTVKRTGRFVIQNRGNFKARTILGQWIVSLRPKSTFLDRPIAVFLIFCFISIVRSEYPLQSLDGFICKTLEWFVIYFLVVEVFVEARHVLTAMAVFMFSAFAVCLDAIIQYHWTKKDFFLGMVSLDNATASFSHANALGGFLIFIVTAAFSVLFVPQLKRKQFYSSFIAFFIICYALIITYSRGAILAALAGVLFSLFFIRRRLFLLVGLTAVLIWVFLFPAYKITPKLETANIEDTTRWRQELWEDSLKILKNQPLLGYGLNTYMKVFQENGFTMRERGHYTMPTYAHNCYVQMAVEVGVLGLGCFMWIIAQLYFNFFREFSKYRANLTLLKFLWVGLAAGIFSFLLHSFVDTHFYSLKLSLLFWFMVAVFVVTGQLLKAPWQGTGDK